MHILHNYYIYFTAKVPRPPSEVAIEVLIGLLINFIKILEFSFGFSFDLILDLLEVFDFSFVLILLELFGFSFDLILDLLEVFGFFLESFSLTLLEVFSLTILLY